ncbi:Very-long-chain 3-oxoacyl-CoA reductase [Madurella mycetomatis]|uniref:Very-long-chain 3-oxoacyl-CoA reductase n=1 Tax=Madurella mycetomatis TaxID=100816 RepID=A0A175VRS2_9PEZI|nr:Very-long-chain 3-oxoacyl-CoA reductase [Madurella mycetomatis]
MALGALFAVLTCIGAATALRFLHSAYQFVHLHFWRPSRPLKAYKRKQGDAYALITGSSAGIGLGIARALVGQGFGVILLGHLADELASAAKTLGTPRVRTIALDARTATPEQISAAADSISDLHLSILVNNVGGIPLAAQPFRPLSALTIAEVDAHLDLNARFMARLTNTMLPLLSANRQEGERSLILNLSSAARHGFPWIVMYSAAKAFNYSFSAALARELEDDPATAHIDCLAVVPGEVQSQSNNLAPPGSAPTSDVYGSAVAEMEGDKAVLEA